jgi:hypothetical protein
MNTSTAQTPYGPSVAGLESGTAVISHEATELYKQYHPGTDAWIAVTNHHVVGSQSHVMCNFHFDLMPFEAQVYKINPNNDIAFLIIPIPHHQLRGREPSDFPIHASDKCDVIGTEVSLVGYPLGTECQTITMGTIASFNVVAGNLIYESTALCNPGNSGGPMMVGDKLLGINTAIMNPGSVITISKTWKTVKSLFVYMKHEPVAAFKVFGLSPQKEHRLRGMYNTSLHPEELLERWNTHCDGDFNEWFNSSSPTMVSSVLHLLEHSPEKLNEFEPPKFAPTRMCPELIVFDSYFKVTPTLTNTASMQMVYPSLKEAGAMICSTGAHEIGIRTNDVLVSINGQKLDNFGRFENGMPYFTAFKDSPAQPVKLQIARQGKSELIDIMYRYDRVQQKNLPKIHASVLTPTENHPVMPLGGLTVTQLTLESAMQFGHVKYTQPEFHNDLVFVVPSVHPASQEWIIQRIAPGSLMTHIDGKTLSEWGNCDQEVWKTVGEKMKRPGVQHITVSFQCKALDGGLKTVQNVYAVKNELCAVRKTPCQCKTCL